jgi:2-methylcitrate dehydratase PrpD
MPEPAGASVAERLAGRIAALRPAGIPEPLRRTISDLLVDGIGLCVAARGSGYVAAALDAWRDPGPCTAIGHATRLGAAAAAFVNGTAAHGEDYDDTFEGGPVHAGAVIVPAVLAVAEREALGGEAVLLGIAVGAETICRLSLVVPKAIHRAGFHPTAVLGAPAAAAGVGAALGLDERRLVNALGVAGSLASGIIEYLAAGAWTKRLHPGWAAQAGLRAALLGRAGFIGPSTVFEGTHGLFHGFAHTADGDYAALVGDFGVRWVSEALAFKPYPCGTMTHPYIDCARRLAARGFAAEDIAEIVCEVAEGTVHRLWEPLAEKRRPPNGYAAKFSTPYCIAAGFRGGALGLDSFSEAAVREARTLALAAKVRYEIDPQNPYPKSYTGHVRAVLGDGRVFEERQAHLRGGAEAPLAGAEIEEKFMRNIRHGGWSEARGHAALAAARRLLDRPIDLAFLRG